MAKTLPPMMQVMRDIGGIELPESLVKLGGDDSKPAQAASANGNANAAAKA
jgi:flotillin